MGSSEKFCLRWNDFESNISVAFRELREEKDFFDVTLACDDSSQVQAHKVILSACSPFFRQILRRNPHQHPLLYLKGVKYKELLAVLNFMYQGEVNVAQEELNSFLVVAEDLRVKGLTQNNSEAGTEVTGRGGSRSEPGKSGGHQRVREPPDRGEAPPPKRQRALAPAPALLHANRVGSTPSASNHSFKKDAHSDVAAASGAAASTAAEDDDDVQELPTIVKSEPRESAAATTARVSTEDGVVVADVSAVDFGSGDGDDDDGEVHGGEVALEDSYQDESYDYGGGGAEYGDVSFAGDDGSGQVIDPTTGMPLGAGASDGNKASAFLQSMLDAEIDAKYERLGTDWRCLDCTFASRNRHHVIEHIEAKHVDHPGYVCGECGVTLRNRSALRSHKSRYHKKPLLALLQHHSDDA